MCMTWQLLDFWLCVGIMKYKDKEKGRRMQAERHTEEGSESGFTLWDWQTAERYFTLHACYKLSPCLLLREQNELKQQQEAEPSSGNW